MDLVQIIKESITLEIAYKVFLFLVLMDLLTGVTKAWKNGNFKSRRMRDGLFQTLGDSMLLFICIVVGMLIPTLSVPILVLIIAMAFRELQSIAENLTEMGVKLPKKFVQGLKVYNDKFENIELIENEEEQLK